MEEVENKDKEYDLDILLENIRQNLGIRIVDFVNSIKEVPDSNPIKSALENLTFADIFNTVEIENEEGCLAELIKFKEKIDFIGIGEINNLIPQCSRDVLKSTIKLLLDGGGYKGYMMETKGQRRGKKYKLIERE